MTLTRRSTLSLAGGAAAMGLVGYLGWPIVGPASAAQQTAARVGWRSAQGGALTGRSRRQSHGPGVLLADLHPLCRVRPGNHAPGGKGPDRTGQGALRLS